MIVITTKLNEIVAVLPDFKGQTILSDGYAIHEVSDNENVIQDAEGRIFFDWEGRNNE